MSYTSRPPFTGGMSNQNQQQQQGGQPNNANIGASGIPNMPMINNAASMPGNHLANTSGASPMSVIDQKIFQQQLMLQRQLLMQGPAFQQQQPTQQNQQPKFQQQPNQTQTLNRLVSEMLNDKNGSNVAQQTQQHLQQIMQMQALFQMQQQAVQQKSFQQQSVPLPTNTTITPVARQNIQPVQKPPVNYPRSNVQNKNLSQNVSSSPMQSRKSFPNAPKSAAPQMQAGMVAAPLNISSSSVKSALPQAMTSAAGSAKGYADILAASLNNSQASMNITPSLTITKTSSPGSTSYAKNSNVLPSKPASSPSSSSSQKSFLSEAISMSLGNVVPPNLLSVHKPLQPPSVTVTPTNKPNISPTNKAIPITPLKTNSPQHVPGLQKLSPTSPRTKQTPRKNTNPIRTTSLSPATQTSSQSAVPHVEITNPSVSVSPSSVNASVSLANATVSKPPSVNVVPATPPKVNPPASVAPVLQTPPRPPQLVPVGNSNAANAKPNAVTPKIETAPVAKITKPIKIEETKATTVEVKSVAPEVKVQKVEKLESVKIEIAKVEKTVDTVKAEKPSASPNKAAPVTTPTPAAAMSQIKPVESKVNKQNASQSATITQSNTNQSEAKTKDNKDKEVTTVKASTEQITKTPVARSARATQAATPVSASADVRSKRNRFKTIPYQSPTPEIELVSKISANEAINAHKKKAKKIDKDDDKLTLFYKNEFLAVRNADGGFFLCQAMNNVYKSSPKIRIRWLSEDDTNKNIYGLDFYDSTDIECVLTSVSLNKLAKGKFQLTKTEHDRIVSILKKALDVEKGIVERPDVTEENPDGLDLSLYKDESQIESKKTSGKRKINGKADSAKKATPVAKKQNSDSAEPPAKRAKTSTNAEAVAKKSAAKNKQADDTKTNESADKNQSTPSIKRLATKRKLVDETNEVQNKKDLKTDANAAKDGETEAMVSKIDGDSPKQSPEKVSVASDSAAQSGRATRRSKN